MWHRGFPTLVLSALFMLVSQSSALCSGDRRGEYLDMRRLIGKEKFREAIVRCKEMLETYPDFVYLYETLPEVSQYAGDLPGAVKYFESRIENGREMGLAYFGLGTTYYYMKDYKSAVLCLNKAVELGVSSPECFRMFEYAFEKLEGVEAAIQYFSLLSGRFPTNANVRYAVALAFWSKHDYSDVLNNINEAMSIDPHEQKYSEAKLAMLLLTNPSKVTASYVATKISSADLRCDLEGSQFLKSYLAIIHLHRNDWDSLIVVASSIFNESRQFGLFRWQGWASVRLSLGWFYVGESDKALEFSLSGVEAGQRAGDDQLVLASLAWKFKAYMQLGNLEAAIETALQRIQKSYSDWNEREYLSSLADLSWVCHELGEDSLAMDCAVEASSRAETIGADWDLLHQTRNMLGVLYQARGVQNAAIRHFEKASALVPKTNFPIGNSIASLALLGGAYLNVGDLGKARKCLFKCLECVERIRLECEKPSTLAEIGRYYFLRGDWRRSRMFYRRAITTAERIRQRTVIQSASRGLGNIEEKLGRFDRALWWYENSITGSRLERISNCALYFQKGFEFNSDKGFHDCARVQIALNRPRDAYVALEKVKLHALLRTTTVPLRIILEQKRDSVEARLLQIRKEIRGTCEAIEFGTTHKVPWTNPPSLLSFKGQLVNLQIKYSALVCSTLVENHGSLFNTMLTPTDLRIFQEEYLSQDQALLQFSVFEGRTDGFLLRRDTLIHFVVLKTSRELTQLMSKMSCALGNVNGSVYIGNPTLANFDRTTSMALYRILISPIESQLGGINKLILVPDGVLSRLPFETLLTDSSSDKSGANTGSHYLIERYDISYVPDLFFVRLSFKGLNSAKKLLLALGDPTLTKSESVKTRVNDLPGPSHKYSIGTSHLPGALEEVIQLRRIFGYKIEIVAGREATESVFKKVASLYRVLHIAAHSTYRDDNPLFSSIQLALDPNEKDDGVLYAFEILTMPLNADLVVLSGCNTGLYSNSRGMDGFAGSLIGAGAMSVMSALWSVDDESTAEFMQNFYSHLAVGHSKSKALQLAKLDFITSNKSDPFYWGAFVLVGDYSRIETSYPSTLDDWRLPTIMLLILTVGGIALKLKYIRTTTNTIGKD